MSVFANVEAETRLIGTLVSSADLSQLILDNYEDGLISDARLKILLDVLLEFRRGGQYLDNTELLRELDKRGLMDHLGAGVKAKQFLTSVYVQTFTSPLQVTQCLETLHKYKVKRIAQARLTELQARLDKDDMEGLNTGLVDTYLEIDTVTGNRWKYAPEEVLRLDDLHEKDWVNTGYPLFDRRFYGIDKGEVNIISGRPGTGKSTFGLNIVGRTARDFWRSNHDNGTNLFCVYYSLEMRRKQLVRRICASEGNILAEDLRDTSNLTASDEAKAEKIKNAYLKLPIIWRIGELKPDQIISDLLALTKKYEIGLAIIDHLHFLVRSQSDERLHVQETVRQFTNLAKRLYVPIILFGQLNREIERRLLENKGKGVTPSLSDLHQGGEWDASKVIFMVPASDDTPQLMGSSSAVKDIDLYLEKSREGVKGSSPLRLLGQYNRFTEESPDEMPPLIEDTETLNDILGKVGRNRKSELTNSKESIRDIMEETDDTKSEPEAPNPFYSLIDEGKDGEITKGKTV